MGPKKGENTKKAAGNARKAEVASQKQAEVEAKKLEIEEEKWSKGSKSNKKAEIEAEKKAEQAAKKAERDKLLEEEESKQRSIPKGTNKKVAEKKTRGLDLSQLDSDGGGGNSNTTTTLNASGIENALDALSLTKDDGGLKMDRHPERRFKAAYKSFEERRLPEIEKEHPGLRKNQRIEIVRKEFEKSEENPFNQVGNVKYDASKEELSDRKREVREGVERRLGER